MNVLGLLNISMKDVQMLKHWGELCDIKVTSHIRDGIVCLHIRDFEFTTYSSAFQFIKDAAQNIVHDENREDLTNETR